MFKIGSRVFMNTLQVENETKEIQVEMGSNILKEINIKFLMHTNKSDLFYECISK